MPLFQVRGRMARSMIEGLGAGTTSVVAQRGVLADLAASMGGEVVGFYVVGGDWQLLVLMDMPINGTLSMMPQLQLSGVFEPGEFRLGIALDAVEIGRAFAAAPGVGDCWGRTEG